MGTRRRGWWESPARCPLDVAELARRLRCRGRRAVRGALARLDAAAAALVVPVALAGGALVGAVAANPRFAGALRAVLGLGE